MLSQKKQDQVIKVCQEFVRVKSYSGQENEVAEKVKATTTEELGFVGREEGISAHSVCLLNPIDS